jgi:hypothetical protein
LSLNGELIKGIVDIEFRDFFYKYHLTAMRTDISHARTALTRPFSIRINDKILVRFNCGT